MTRVRRALLSVHDKTGVVDFARGLGELGVELLSTAGTARLLRESGIAVHEVADVTGFAEILDGRVKTLHPRIHGGILARRDSVDHMRALDRHGIEPIDLVAVTLYPFEATIASPGTAHADAIEQIDVGGPALIRAAAKNHASVAVVTDPTQYGPVLDELRAKEGELSSRTRHQLARSAFRRTSEYDSAIAGYLRGPDETEGGAVAEPPALPAQLTIQGTRMLALRYGENPHQAAAFYRLAGAEPFGLASIDHVHGPELSYNNLLDFSAALALLLEFDEPAAVVIKHTNPCGAALGASAAEALHKAKASDPVSIYGSIVGVNRAVDRAAVRELSGIFVEIVFAPDYDADALEELRRTKRKARVFKVSCDREFRPPMLREYRSVLGGLLAQSADLRDLDPARLTVVSRRPPTPTELRGLRLAWRVAKHVKSNAIILATATQVIGVGAGQMNRLDSARIAVMRAKEFGLDVKGAVCASDAFFPFRDGLDVLAQAGVTAAIHPGGSVRDAEIIAAANEHDVAMVTTGIRHFRH